MSHWVQGLSWARQSERPKAMPIGRPRGAKAAGVRFERLVAKAMPQAKHGLWWEFVDASGRHWCQTDLVLEGRDSVLVVECKYTWTRDAQRQLEGLYLPVVSWVRGKPAYGVQLCKVLTPEATGVCPTLEDALALARSGAAATWHWIPGTPLRTRSEQFPQAA